PAGGEVAVLLGPAVPPVPVPGHRVEVRAEPTPGWWELTVGRQQPTDAETRGPHRRRSGGVRAGHRPRRDPRGRAGSARRRPAVRGAARRAPATPAHGARNGPDGRYRHVGRTARRTGLRAAGLGRQHGRAHALRTSGIPRTPPLPLLGAVRGSSEVRTGGRTNDARGGRT